MFLESPSFPVFNMEDGALWFALPTVLTTVATLQVREQSKSRLRLPPGPRPWPVLGNLLQLGDVPHHNLAKLAQKYGPLMFMWLGSKRLLVVTSPEYAEEVLKKQDEIWANRGTNIVGKIFAYDHSDIAFSDYGTRWQEYRTIFSQEVMSTRSLNSFKKGRQQEVMRGINLLVEQCAGGTRAASVSSIMRKITLKVAVRMLVNEDELDSKIRNVIYSEEFQQMTEECSDMIGNVPIGDFIPWLDRFDIGGIKRRLTNAAVQLDGVLSDIVEDQRHRLSMESRMPVEPTINNRGAVNLVKMLLNWKSERDNQPLADHEIKAIMQDIMLAGLDTSAATLTWAVCELVRHPRIMQRAQEEMDSVVGRDRLVDESDLRKLPYLYAVVREVMRMYPPGAMLIPHESSQECCIDGYTIPARTRLLVNCYAIQRDPAYWDRPNEFLPERFLNSKKDVYGRSFDYLPFGSGRRSCAGKALAMSQLQYVIAAFIQTIHLHLPAGMTHEDVDVEEVFLFSLVKRKPLDVIAVPRLEQHLLQSLEE